MSGLSDITANLENSRNCLRRIARHDEEPFSKDSLVNIMEKFVKSVNYMDETILIPCRLMDRQVGDATDTVPQSAKTSIVTTSHYNNHHHNNNHHHSNHLKNLNGCRKDRNQQTIHEFLNAADLFNLYNMLNSLKNDLLWTRNNVDIVDEYNNDDYDYDESANITTTTTGTLSTITTYGSTSNMSITSTSSSSTLSNQDQDVRCKCNYEQQQQQQQQQQHQQQHSQNNNSGNSNSNNNSNIIRSSAVGGGGVGGVGGVNNVETIKGHIRRPSTASMTSSNSVSNLSDAESDLSNENDSGIESEVNCSGEKGRKCCNGNLDKATELARQCRTHLSGLYRCLEQMTEAANYLTARYQSDIGSV